MKVKISDHMTYKSMFKLTIMPILMNVFMSCYSIVDGICISAFGSEDAFAGVNLIFPIIMIVGGLGFMFGTGGSALSAKYLGEGKQEKANNVFTLLLITTLVVGVICSIGGAFAVAPLARLMASVTQDATEGMVKEAIRYGQVLMLGQTCFMLQSLFQSYFLVAERSQIGFVFTVGAGVLNMALDLVFVGLLKWGVIGAAIATIIGQMYAGIGSFVYFMFRRKGRIWLGKFKISFSDIGQSCWNGSSEFVNNISSAIVGVVFNIQLLKYIGQIGISAYGALMYISLIFILIFVGFSCGVAPSTSFQYGAQNTKELSLIRKRCMFVIWIMSGLIFIISEILARPLGDIFSSGNTAIADLTTKAIRIFSISFLMSGFGIYSSSFFTALNNGLISAIISFFRCLVFQVTFVFVLPLIFGGDAIWYSMIVAEFGSFVLSLIFLIAKRKQYNYFEKVPLF